MSGNERDSRGIERVLSARAKSEDVAEAGMETSVAELIELLEDERRLQEGLHDLGTRKRDALVRLDVPAVEKTTREEQSVLVAVGETTARRLKLCQEMARKFGLSDAHATVRDLASRLPSAERARVFASSQELKRVLTRVGRVNRSNRLLTEQALRSVQDFFQIVTGAAGGDSTYGRTGQGSAPPGRWMFDRVA